MPVLRPAETRDLDAYCDLWNAVWPNLAKDVSELRRDDEKLPEEMRAVRWIAYQDGVPAAFAEVYRPVSYFHLQKWMLHVGVLPEFRQAGIGSELFLAAWSHLERSGWITVSSRVQEDDRPSIRFAADRGFSEANRDFESLLALSEVEDSEMQELMRRIPAEVRLEPFDRLDSGDFRHRFHALFENVRQDIPRLEPAVPLSFEFFQTNVLEDPLLLREGSYVAMLDKEPIGLSGIFQGANEGWIDQWLTAVRKDWRGRGIASALKAKTALWARAAGYSTLRTDNNSLNQAMLSINDRFGFRRSAAILTVRKQCVY